MIPIKDDNPQINVPYATYLFVFLNIVVWIFVQNLGLGLEHEMSVCKFGLIPLTFQEQGIETSCLDLNDWGYFSVISSMFLHGNWMHLLGNLLFLWVFGGNVEDSMGAYRFTAFYLLVGVFAGFSHIITNMGSSVPMIGASGAIGGVMGAYLMLFPKVKVHIFVPIFIIFWTFRIPAFFMLGYWIFLQLIEGILTFGINSEGIAFWAHVGGFVCGAVTIYFFKDKELLHGHPYYGWHQIETPSSIWEDSKNKQD